MVTNLSDLDQYPNSAADTERSGGHVVQPKTEAATILIGVSAAGDLTEISDSALQITGYSRDELGAGNFWQLLYPGALYRQVEDLFEQMANATQVHDYPMRMRISDGSHRLLSWTSFNRYDAAGQLIEVIGLGVDVAPDVAQIRALKAAEQRLSEVQRVGQIGCWELDMQRDRYWWSAEVLQLLEIGNRRPVETYDEFLALLNTEDRAVVMRAFALSISEHTDFDLQFSRTLANGQVKHLRSRGHTSFNADGEPVRTFGTLQDVTREVDKDLKLRESLKQIAELGDYSTHVVEHSPAFIVAVAPDGIAKSINPAGCRFMERSADEIVGENIWEMMYPGDLYDQVSSLFEQFAKHGGVTQHEMTMASRSGVERILSWTSVNRYSRVGDLVDVIGVGQDVTDLRQSQAQLIELQNIAGIGGWEHDADTDSLIWTNEARQALKLEAAVLGETWASFIALVHPDDRNVITESYHRSLTSNEPYSINYRLCLPDGGVKHIQARSRNRIGANGVVRRASGTVQDLTAEVEQHERLEAALKETTRLKQYNEHVVENSPSMIVATTPDGLTKAINRSGLDILGSHEDEIIGKDLWALLCPGKKYEQVERMLAQQRHSRRIHNFQLVVENSRGEERILAWSSIDRFDDDGNLIEAVGIANDVTELRRSQNELEYLAHHDPLTALPNRLLLQARLEQALADNRQRGSDGSLLYIDLDRFKNVNDSLGHNAGDALLKAAAGRLKNCVRSSDMVARLGGDEFTLLLNENDGTKTSQVIAEKVLGAFDNPFQIDGHEIFVTPSIGISLFPRDGDDIDTILRNADSAMYKAKKDGRNGYAVYTQKLTAEALQRVELEAELRRALELEQLVVHYQPQVELVSGKLIGAEALVRWEHPDRGLIPPNMFLPLAEETGLIIPLGEWVLGKACRAIKAWLDSGIAIPRVAVNLAGMQIRRTDLPNKVASLLKELDLPVSHLELEVTEGFIMSEAENAIEVLDALRELGIRLSIDDFGTGYSSLSYLKRLPINQLKIDRSFVMDIPGDADDLAITGAIIAMAHSLRLEVVAEGIETEAQREALIAGGCVFGQGYLFSRPLPADQFTTWAKANSG